MALLDPVKKFLFGIALKKGVVSAAKLMVSYAIAHGIKLSVTLPNGIAIDTTSEAGMVIAINSGLTVLCNWLKQKWPEKFGWL